jgi:protein TonB
MLGFEKGPWQDGWSHHRSPYLRIVLIVVVVHVLVFLFAPPFHFKPYRLEAQEIMVVEDIPDFDIPEAPPEEPKPPVQVDPIEGPVDEDIPVPPTTYERIEDLPLPPRLPVGDASTFDPVDRPPLLKRFVKPHYPELAREAGIEGVVTVRVTIDETGKVTSAVVVTSDVTDAMNRAALAAARECTFEPARQGQKPVPVAVVIPFAFRLDQR